MLNNDEVIFLGRDNSIDLILYSNGSAVDLSAVTDMKLAFYGTTVILASTNASTDAIRWAQSSFELGEIQIEAGGSSLLTPLYGKRYRCSLVVFDPSNSTGIVWDDNIPIRVKADPLAT